MAYLTDTEYLNRYGNAETIRLTDENRSGAVDTQKLENAIADASDIADSYLGKRYVVPVLSPPALLKHVVAALAREILHTSRPIEAVTNEANRARHQLELISKGTIVLPVPENATPPTETGSFSSASSGDGTAPVFTEAALSGFDINTGYPNSAWKA
jgi:phage gp36-like protein